MSLTKQIVGLIVALIVCFAAAGIGSLFTMPAIPGWYAALDKPAWTPPSWVFGPVWSLLYTLMAIAAWLVWRKCGFAGAQLPLTLFGLQLVLNVLWSFLFFGLRLPAAAFADIVLLWLAILATLLTFWRISVWTGVLLIPYLAWVTFAAALNYSIAFG